MKSIDSEEQKFIDRLIDDQFNLINITKNMYPKIKIRLSKEELKIINEVAFENVEYKNNYKCFYDCMNYYILNTLFNAVSNNQILNIEYLKNNWIYLSEYYSVEKIIVILSEIEKRYINKIDCNIISFPNKKKIR